MSGEPDGSPTPSGSGPPSEALPPRPCSPPSSAWDPSEPAHHQSGLICPATYRPTPVSTDRSSVGSCPSPAAPAPAQWLSTFYLLSTARGAVLPELGRHTFLDEHKTPCQEPTGSQCLPWQYEREPGEAGGSFLESQPRQACRLTHHVWSLVPPSAGGTHLRSTAHSPGSEF